MTPLTKETKHLMNEREFNMMKSSSIFINGSRGETVNEAALYDALKYNKILGAGMDVYEKEPINPDNPLLDQVNVVSLPHIGSATTETRTKMGWLAAENLLKGIVNEKPPSLINKELLNSF
jgi:gluconate 2-dehydrogenase